MEILRRSLPKVFAHRLYSADRIKFANASQVYYHKSSYFHHLLPLNILRFNATPLNRPLPLPLKHMAHQMRRLSAKLKSKPEPLTISPKKPNNVALILLLTKSFAMSTLSTVPNLAILLSKQMIQRGESLRQYIKIGMEKTKGLYAQRR